MCETQAHLLEAVDCSDRGIDTPSWMELQTFENPADLKHCKCSFATRPLVLSKSCYLS